MRRTDWNRAIELLRREDYTCVLCRGDAIRWSRERGVKPLLTLLDSGESLREFAAADRVVGKAAAYLYVLLGVRSLYAGVISRPAKETLERFGIELAYETLVDGIRNRTGDGFCPMESAVREIEEPEQALAAIRETLRRLQNSSPKA